jgi:hypothetical protein
MPITECSARLAFHIIVLKTAKSDRMCPIKGTPSTEYLLASQRRPHPSSNAQNSQFSAALVGTVGDQAAEHIDSSLFLVSRGSVKEAASPPLCLLAGRAWGGTSI